MASSSDVDRARDTIVALATGPGQAALATVRVAGPRTRGLLDQVLRQARRQGSPELVDRRATLARLVDPADGASIDQVVVTFFSAPRSYTGDDLAELTLHGGPWLVAEAIRVLTSLGATPARPGEFTRRALLAGKLDLAQAEAIQELVLARSSAAAKLAVRHLGGALSHRYARIREALTKVLASLEAPLEFPDDVAEEEPAAILCALERVAGVRSELLRLAESRSRARRITCGTSIPIIGRPNAGKSSIFNQLLGSDRAIVSPRAGTTRDSIEASMMIGGRLIRLVDTAGLGTAGLGTAADDVDEQAMQRTEAQIEDADIVILVLDRSAPLEPADQGLGARVAGRSVVPVLNKSDLPGRLLPADLERLGVVRPPVVVSAVSGAGFSALIDRVEEEVACLSPSSSADLEDDAVTSARQQGLLSRAVDDLDEAARNLHRGSAELAIEDLRIAEARLGELVGESSPDDVLDEVFRSFCIGK